MKSALRKHKKSSGVRIILTDARTSRHSTGRFGWVGERLYTVIFEVREDREGEYYHLVTLWKATKEEQRLYEEYS